METKSWVVNVKEMNQFKTRYNYLILVARFIFTIFFGALSIIMIYVLIKDSKSNNYLSEFFFGIVFNIIMIYLTYHFAILIIKQSYNFKIEENSIFKISILSGRKELLKTNQIKGFSISEYPIKIWNFKSIILYLANGKKIELPQFLYFNFNKIENELIENSITKLGHEKHKWKSFDSRYYEYE
ncbi:hypothetical protein IW18_19165 [Flavobacterium hibernum]|uniref:Uncharacterized protein n=2 Tax=Flavobacterium hibernum TaxID=37752 RepID=A0A0D0EDS9_9FLAO|nr:hypothetical protein [Flavobacterium hibernum]KIO51134.1 hypothetical protein IW18_19165 [Flavobacterium hibernum]OXA86198.1 hypothetical protein B0A73_15220 [Flavobacterium hibernum]PTT03813.1 hypothetical protein DBR27_10120 [Flavobacterium sp. HMWF030]STO14552.1 Uncharacterised protein [Flavobacterium hibernum]